MFVIGEASRETHERPAIFRWLGIQSGGGGVEFVEIARLGNTFGPELGVTGAHQAQTMYRDYDVLLIGGQDA